MRLIYVVTLSCIAFIASCEGGKSKSVACAPGQDAGLYGSCETPNNGCPTGQAWVNGQCKPGSSLCEEGEHFENNKCVVDTQNCPLGQQEQNGVCVPIPLECPPGQHEQNGACVEDTINCPGEQVSVNGECVENTLTITPVNEHTCWIENNGVTRMTIEYVVRDVYGNTVAPENEITRADTLETQLFVNSRPLDVESKVTQTSVVLNSDLALSLVLDGSYSMLRHNPPAFEPMKNAATSILRETKNIWNQNGSQFHWELSWFDTLIYRPANNNADETWSIEDISRIPAPKAEVTPTALRKAIASMIDVHEELYADGIATDVRDQHVMIVLTDGRDNNSDSGQIEVSEPSRSNEDGTLFWQAISYPATYATDLQSALSAVPNLKVFVIGLGDQVSRQELQNIADWGNGRYFYGENSTNLGALFNTVRREFITQLTLQADIPLPSDEYTFTLEARVPDTDISGQYNFSKSVSKTALPLCTQ